MADERPPEDRGYDWLYSDDAPPSRRGGGASADEEQTRATPRVEDESEHTRVLGDLPTAGRGQDGSGAAGRSFGGTYAPAARPEQPAQQRTESGPRFLEPSTPRPPTTTVPKRQRRPRRKRRWWLRSLVLLVVAWLVFLFVVPVYAWSQVSKVDARPPIGRPGATPGTTYLLVGSDSRAGLTSQQKADLGTGSAAGKRTDTIILVHVPDGSGPTLWLSIPRDSYVEIPGHGKHKINAAFAIGGADLLVHTVEQNTGIRIDNYIEVGFTGLVRTVDAVGGITVCPKTSIDDPKAGHLKMSAGCHHIDGHKALDYSRSRAFAKGDITREKHQREVIAAIGDRAASWKTIVLPWRYWDLNMAAADSVHVGRNVGIIGLGRLAWAMVHANGDSVKRCVVPYSSLGTTTSAGSSVIWDEDKAKALFRKVRQDDTSDIHCAAE